MKYIQYLITSVAFTFFLSSSVFSQKLLENDSLLITTAKIKTVTIMQKELKDCFYDEGCGEWQLFSFSEYDREGRQLYYQKGIGSEQIDIIERKKYQDGVMTEKTYLQFKLNSIQNTIGYTYDSLNHLLMIKDKHFAGNYNSVYYTLFNWRDGHVVEKKILKRITNPTSIFKYKYDLDGDVVKETEFFLEDSWDYPKYHEVKFTYDSVKQVVHKGFYSGNDTLLMTLDKEQLFDYDEFGQKIKEVYTESQNHEEISYVYKNGRIIEIKTSNSLFDAEVSSPPVIIRYIYNGKGVLKKASLLKKDELVAQYKYVYSKYQQ